MRSPTRTHTQSPNNPPTHTTAIMNQTHTSLDPSTPLPKITRQKDPLKLSTLLKKKNNNNTPFVSGTSVSVFLRLRLPPCRGHPSRGHPSRSFSVSAFLRVGDIRLGDIRLGLSPSPPSSVSGTSVSGTSVSGASVSGTSVFETAKAKTNGTDGYPGDGKTWRRRVHPSQLSISGASACAFRLCHPSPAIQLK